MELTDLYSAYQRINSVLPRILLKLVLYSYMKNDHATFARFRSIHFAPCAKWILAQMSNTLFELGEISGKTLFLDETKIEVNGNKYTFVWKKAVAKN